VGVILGYPGERADPLEREEASDIDVLSMAEDVTKLPTSSSEQSSPRQPPTVSDTTAAAFLRSTLVMSECSLSGRGQGHVSNFYIVDLENFATECRRYTLYM